MKEKTARTPSSKKRRKSNSTKGGESSDKPKVPFTSSNDSAISNEVKNSICRYLIENGHDFSAAASPSFKKMISLCLGKVECEIPTVEELKGSVFNDIVNEMDVYVSNIKSSWADTGCSVLLDEWTDPKGRSMMNVVVDCPKGAIYLNSYDVSDISGDIDAIQNFFEVVLMEIGIGNVVQVVTNPMSSITNEFRMQLTDKFRSVFWTRSASCCIRLMLEEISAIDRVKETLDKANIIAGFDGLEYLRCQRNVSGLINRFRKICHIRDSMFRFGSGFILFSPTRSLFTSTVDGKTVELLSDSSFRSGALTAVDVAMPLINVIDWMDANDKAQIGYIYKKIDQASNTEVPYRNIIENVRREQLYNPLHSAGYFLNPYTFHLGGFVSDHHQEVAMGLLSCVVRSTEDVRLQDKIVLQLEQYRNAKGRFSKGCNTYYSISITPVQWWSKYGKDCPELQRLAIRILSQTCNGASKFRLDRKLAETLITEEMGRKLSEQKKLREMTYLRYNMMLQNYESGEFQMQ